MEYNNNRQREGERWEKPVSCSGFEKDYDDGDNENENIHTKTPMKASSTWYRAKALQVEVQAQLRTDVSAYKEWLLPPLNAALNHRAWG